MLPRQLRLGEILVNEGLITNSQLEEALLTQKRDPHKKPIGEILVYMGSISEENLALALSKRLNMPYLSIQPGTINIAKEMGFQDLVPETFARQHNALPYNKTSSVIQVVFGDPLDVVAMDNLKHMTHLEVIPAIATLSDIKRGLDELYGKENLYKRAVEQVEAASAGGGEIGLMEKISVETTEEIDIDTLRKTIEEAPLIKLVDILIMEAINGNASDIHIERFENKVSIRYRIDGVLYEIPPPAKQFYLPLVSRIKILSKIDIAEKRLPQDGGFMVRTKDRVVDLRVSTMPTIYGEKVVIRILDKTKMTLDLKNLGFETEDLKKFKRTVKRPYGLIVITGPTGSGKTTTLYATLSELYTPQKNIVTIEDPVEYRLEGVNQVQVRAQIGLTFANGVRTFLRQDPDIIMVGEIRDYETAEICIRAALAGRLVLSTLHTNNAAIAATRLIEFGLEPFLINSSVIMIEAQRLVRKLCPSCKQPYEPDAQVQKKYGLGAGPIYKSTGCDKCRHIGYSGRTGIYEVLVLDEDIRELISRKAGANEIRDLAVKQGMRTLLDSGIEKVRQGITSLEEVLSIIFTE
jgi:type IV pilus assembly protein PilB